MISLIIRLLAAVVLAFLAKLISKIKFTVHIGLADSGNDFRTPCGFLMNQQILDARWYQTMVHILECAVGLMIGTELVWNKIKRSGKAIVITTFTQSVGTFYLYPLFSELYFIFRRFLCTWPFYLAELPWLQPLPLPYPLCGNLRQAVRSPTR